MKEKVRGRVAFEPARITLIGFDARDIITTSNGTGIYGEEYDIFGNLLTNESEEEGR